MSQNVFVGLLCAFAGRQKGFVNRSATEWGDEARLSPAFPIVHGPPPRAQAGALDREGVSFEDLEPDASNSILAGAGDRLGLDLPRALQQDSGADSAASDDRRKGFGRELGGAGDGGGWGDGDFAWDLGDEREAASGLRDGADARDCRDEYAGDLAREGSSHFGAGDGGAESRVSGRGLVLGDFAGQDLAIGARGD